MNHIVLFQLTKKTSFSVNKSEKFESNRKQARKNIIFAALWLLGGFFIGRLGLPFPNIPLIWHWHSVAGHLVDTYSEEIDNELGQRGVTDYNVYSYNVGNLTYTTTESSVGGLSNTEQVNYLPENPSISRIGGWRCYIFWFFNKIVLRSLFIAVPSYFAFMELKSAFRLLKESQLP